MSREVGTEQPKVFPGGKSPQWLPAPNDQERLSSRTSNTKMVRKRYSTSKNGELKLEKSSSVRELVG